MCWTYTHEETMTDVFPCFMYVSVFAVLSVPLPIETHRMTGSVFCRHKIWFNKQEETTEIGGCKTILILKNCLTPMRSISIHKLSKNDLCIAKNGVERNTILLQCAL